MGINAEYMGIGMKPPFAACLLALLLALSASLDIEENPDLGTGISELVGEGRRACSGTSSWDAIDASATSNTAGNDEEDDELGVSVLDLARVTPAAKPQAKPAAMDEAKAKSAQLHNKAQEAVKNVKELHTKLQKKRKLAAQESAAKPQAKPAATTGVKKLTDKYMAMAKPQAKPAAKPQAKPAAKPQAKPAATPKAQAQKEKKYKAELKKVVVTSTKKKPEKVEEKKTATPKCNSTTFLSSTSTELAADAKLLVDKTMSKTWQTECKAKAKSLADVIMQQQQTKKVGNVMEIDLTNGRSSLADIIDSSSNDEVNKRINKYMVKKVGYTSLLDQGLNPSTATSKPPLPIDDVLKAFKNKEFKTSYNTTTGCSSTMDSSNFAYRAGLHAITVKDDKQVRVVLMCSAYANICNTQNGTKAPEQSSCASHRMVHGCISLLATTLGKNNTVAYRDAKQSITVKAYRDANTALEKIPFSLQEPWWDQMCENAEMTNFATSLA